MRDADGMLPYGKDLRVSYDRKKNSDEYIQSSISVGQGHNNATQHDSMTGKPDVKTIENREKSDNLSYQQGKKRKLPKNPRYDITQASLEERPEEEDHMGLMLTIAGPLGASNPNNPTNVAGPEHKGDDGELVKKVKDGADSNTYTIGGGWKPAPPGAMNLLCWNCRGLGTDSTVGELHHLVKRYHPSLLFLSDTKMRDNKVRRFSWSLGFVGCVAVSSEGKSGGLALFWADGCSVSLKHYIPNIIDVLITMMF